ncbi:MAG: IPTL-CTERM sorting domain-containing protein [Betaproteobacteria bacterium]
MSRAKSTLDRILGSGLLSAVGFAALLGGALPAAAQISLGTAVDFGVLAGSAVTNVGASVVTGNLGISPGSAISGFPPGIVTPPGVIHSADAIAAQAQVDLTTAYNALASTPTLVDLTGVDLGGLTLTPGVYGFASSAQLTGTLTLDALGNPNALFLFKIGSTLTTASGSSVNMINGGSACNVYWQVGSSATLGTTTSFAGNILALASITMTTGANLLGRALARNGAVTMAGNSVSGCAGAPVVCPVVTLNPASLPAGVVGTSYSQAVTASGGVAPYTYAVSSGTLPGGLSLNPATGAITGTPTTFGTFNFTITATDSNGCPGSRAYEMVIAAAACPAITLNPPTLPSGHIGTPYSQVVVASGGMAPYTYSVSSGTLPGGLSLNPVTGAITGTPATAGIFNFTITATDNNGCPGSRPYTIVISAVACPAITLSPATLSAPVLGIPYNQTVTASGGTPPYTYTVSSGALPPGLSLNSATGAITGTPTAIGAFGFTITATDANGCLALLNFTMSITGGGTPIATAPIPTLSEWGLFLLMLLTGLVAVRYLRRN